MSGRSSPSSRAQGWRLELTWWLPRSYSLDCFRSIKISLTLFEKVVQSTAEIVAIYCPFK
jgi:hypothetical protein